jgi:hypothetical protein
LIPWSGDEGDDGICGSPGAADARFAAASVLLDLTVRDVTTFTRNRDRLLDGEVTGKFLTAVLSQDKVKRLLSSEHFSVDGTLLEAWASPKSFRPKDGSGAPPALGRNGAHDFHGVRRRNETRLDHRPRYPALAQGARQGSAAVFHGPCADGEPLRLDRRRSGDPLSGHAERLCVEHQVSKDEWKTSNHGHRKSDI